MRLLPPFLRLLAQKFQITTLAWQITVSQHVIFRKVDSVSSLSANLLPLTSVISATVKNNKLQCEKKLQYGSKNNRTSNRHVAKRRITRPAYWSFFHTPKFRLSTVERFVIVILCINFYAQAARQAIPFCAINTRAFCCWCSQ